MVERHSRYAGAVAFGVTGNYHDAADVVQDAFLKVYQRIDALDDATRFRGWLRQLVRSTAIDRIRRRRGHASLDAGSGDDESPIEPPDGGSINPDELLQREELRRGIRERIAGLPESQREVVAMKYLEGLSYEEIAEATGSTVASVESRLHRARARLKDALSLLLQKGG